MNQLSTEARSQIIRCLHQTLRCTPAMEAGIADHIWGVEEIVGLLDWQPERRKEA